MKICLQKWMPQHSVSRLVGKLASCRVAWLKNFFIRWFIKQYEVDMSEAEQPDYREYPNFNVFFTRPLKAGARVFPDNVNQLACPVDGYVSELGSIRHDQLFQAKGHHFKLLDLLGGDETMAAQFYDGHFLTAYLSPKDYHCIHMPIAGQLQKMIHVPGDLFSVNPYTVTHVPSLFARNERVVCLFETDLGPMVIVLVGAVIVASIATVWHGVVTPPTSKTIQQWDYGNQNVLLNRGEEMGHFQLGSTVIVLFGKDRILWDPTLKAGDVLKMGQGVGLKI